MSTNFAEDLSLVVYSLLLPMSVFKEIYSRRLDYIDYRFIIIVIALLLFTMLAIVFISKELFKNNSSRAAAVAQVLFRCNYTVIGLPLLQTMLPEKDLIICYMVLPFTIAFFNAGSIFLILSCKNMKESSVSIINLIKDILTSPFIIAVFIGILFLFTDTYLPLPLERIVTSIGATGAPMALIALGGSFRFKAAMKNLPFPIKISLSRLLILPTIIFAICYALNLKGAEFATILFLVATPSAASCYPVAKKMGVETTITSQVVVFTHLLSGGTLLFWIWLMRTIGIV